MVCAIVVVLCRGADAGTRIFKCAVQRLESRLLQRAGDEKSDRVLGPIVAIFLARFHFHRRRYLQNLPYASARNTMAPMDDNPVHVALAGKSVFLPN